MNMPVNWLQTYSGQIFDLDSPRPEMVRLEDIAHGLANLCRFGGQCRHFYSVAQHCVIGADHLRKIGGSYGALRALCFLLHDASEAYVVDVPRPVKKILGLSYANLEDKVQAAILAAFNLAGPFKDNEGIIKVYDNTMLMTERRDLMNHTLPWREEGLPFPDVIRPWSPEVAERAYYTSVVEFAETAEIELSESLFESEIVLD